VWDQFVLDKVELLQSKFGEESGVELGHLLFSSAKDYDPWSGRTFSRKSATIFADEAGVWETKLLFVNDCLLLLNIQRRWVYRYLEPLFARPAA